VVTLKMTSCRTKSKKINLTPKGLRPFFSKNTPNLPFLAQEAQMNFFKLFALSTVGFTLDYKENMCKKFQKSWLHRLWDYNIWSGKKSFFPLYSVGIADFDCLWCKLFELCNCDLLYHCNAHHVRYLYTKS
jgi:hypothetical protein